jgi:Zn finger protein HypA/HybF involved in hydrogenase expression
VTIWKRPEQRPESEPKMIGEILAGVLEGAMSEAVRWPLVRTGDREPIIWAIRLAVGRRDEFTCRRCHIDVLDRFELDHIIPWSAGGSDRSDNLRVLCPPCNQRRSNFRDSTRPATPITWWCVQCWTEDNAFRYRQAEDMRIDHQVAAPHVTAYCAHCHHISKTDVTL